MGNDVDEPHPSQPQLAWLTGSVPIEAAIPIVSWLDADATAQVRAIVAAVARAHREIVAAILFGSIARHDERPIDDEFPSDVDLLLLLDPIQLGEDHVDYPLSRELELFGTIGAAAYRLPESPREVKVLLVQRSLARWDEAFIANVAHDGLLLWARSAEPLPDRWRHLAARRPDVEAAQCHSG
jgi:predicted nucleotidyltransferase